jgi:hypothetical protein
MNGPASGWYPDPNGPPGQQRWWNGEAWGEQTRQADTAAPVPPAAPTRRRTRWWAWGVLAIVVLIVIAAATSDTSTSTDSGPNLASPTTDTAPTAQQPVSERPQKPLHFEGNGRSNIGTIRLTRDSVIAWSNRGGYGDFTIDNLSSSNYDDPSLLITSSHHSGDSIMDAGTYHHVNVDGGDWMIDITAK